MKLKTLEVLEPFIMNLADFESHPITDSFMLVSSATSFLIVWMEAR